MPKGSDELIKAREDEIIRACEELYKTKNFRDITIADIGQMTTLSRPSIYNYFQTKEEIFLALLKREYEAWAAQLQKTCAQHDAMTPDEFASSLAHSLEDRQQMLKLLAMNLFEIENNSRPKHLAEFKKTYGKAIGTIKGCLERFLPDMTAAEREDFITAFFPFVFGVYPYTHVSDQQLAAMEEAGIHYEIKSVYDLTYPVIRQLLGKR